MAKFDFEDLKKKLSGFAGNATAASVATGQLIWSPKKFHVARLRRRKTRLAESMQFAVFSSAAMIVMYYVTVSSVIKVRHPRQPDADRIDSSDARRREAAAGRETRRRAMRTAARSPPHLDLHARA